MLEFFHRPHPSKPSSSPSKPLKPSSSRFEAFEAFLPSSSPSKASKPPSSSPFEAFVLTFEAFEAFVFTLRSLRSLPPFSPPPPPPPPSTLHLRRLRRLRSPLRRRVLGCSPTFLDLSGWNHWNLNCLPRHENQSSLVVSAKDRLKARTVFRQNPSKISCASTWVFGLEQPSAENVRKNVTRSEGSWKKKATYPRLRVGVEFFLFLWQPCVSAVVTFLDDRKVEITHSVRQSKKLAPSRGLNVSHTETERVL